VAIPIGGPEVSIAPPSPERDHTVQLLQDAIARLKSSNGDLPDPAQVASLLAEAREALERANVIARAAAQSEAFLKDGQFDQALEALDAALLLYPADAALVTRRRKVEEKHQAYQSAAAVRTALEQADWLLHQDRTDLAAHFLEERVADLPDQPDLIARLEELEALLPSWEQKRHVQATLGRVATLVQLQQSEAALTILEEALQSYPASEELIAEAKRVREQVVDQERRKKLARRLELIGQKIAARSWRQALTLLESTQEEFPSTPELNPLWCEVNAGLRRSECDAIGAELRQCLADGELELAEEVLRRGTEAFGEDPALEALRQELASKRQYREELRTAQILFGRRQLQEAERILSRIVAQDRPEAQALLEAVKGARAAAEEENFCENGREKAVELIQQQQFAQAADLLRNLLALFPGNTILERELMVAQKGLDHESSQAAPAAVDEDPEPPPQAIAATSQPASKTEAHAGPANRIPVPRSAPSRFRRAAVTGTVSLALASAAGLAWKSSRTGAPAPKQAATPPATLPPSAAPLPVTSAPADPVSTATGQANIPQTNMPQTNAPQQSVAKPPAAAVAAAKPRPQPLPPPRGPLRQFVPPNAKQTPGQSQSAALPLPPGTEPVISMETTPLPLAGLGKPLDGPVPPPAAPPQPAAAEVAKPAAVHSGGKATEALLVDRTMPVYPAVARAHSVFGIVRLKATIDIHGAVKDVTVMSGDPVLAAAARTAVLKWRYRPATLNDQPIVSSALIQINFGDQNK
jgi:TonB family protein